MRECADLGVKRVWMHPGARRGKRVKGSRWGWPSARITVIEGGYPCMFGPTAGSRSQADAFGFTLTGNAPRRV